MNCLLRNSSIPAWLIILGVISVSSEGAEQPSSKGRPEPYDWIEPMRTLTREFRGEQGKVLRLGDSITYANPGSAFLRYGKDRTRDQLDVCKWMKADVADKSSGVWLSIHDQPGGRSFTAASGVTSGQFIAGGKGGLPKLDDIIREYNPQVACVLLGTNDINGGQSMDDYTKNMDTIITRLLANKTIPLLTTIPPIQGKLDAVVKFNEAVWKLGEKYKLPIVDYYGEIIGRRANDWQGTLISADGVHPSAGEVAGPATDENLAKSGYLLFGWATLNKLVEIKKNVIQP